MIQPVTTDTLIQQALGDQADLSANLGVLVVMD